MTDLPALIKRHPELKKAQKYGTYHYCDTYYDPEAELRMADAALAEALKRLDDYDRIFGGLDSRAVVVDGDEFAEMQAALAERMASEVELAEESEWLREQIAKLNTELSGILRSFSGVLVNIMTAVNEASLVVEQKTARLSAKEPTDGEG